jgi:hypothetical protein
MSIFLSFRGGSEFLLKNERGGDLGNKYTTIINAKTSSNCYD